MTMASPSANVELGMVIEPPEPTCTYFPTSVVANEYELVLVPDAGKFLYPTVNVSSGNVTVLSALKVAGVRIVSQLPVPPERPLISIPSCVEAARANTPLAPVVVKLVPVAAPILGVVNVGLEANTTLPEPVVDADDAAVNLPCASTVIDALVYDPADTAVFANATDGAVLVPPMEMPVPAETLATFATNSLLILVMLLSPSVQVKADPLPALVTIVAIM